MCRLCIIRMTSSAWIRILVPVCTLLSFFVGIVRLYKKRCQSRTTFPFTKRAWKISFSNQHPMAVRRLMHSVPHRYLLFFSCTVDHTGIYYSYNEQCATPVFTIMLMHSVPHRRLLFLNEQCTTPVFTILLMHSVPP